MTGLPPLFLEFPKDPSSAIWRPRLRSAWRERRASRRAPSRRRFATHLEDPEGMISEVTIEGPGISISVSRRGSGANASPRWNVRATAAADSAMGVGC